MSSYGSNYIWAPSSSPPSPSYQPLNPYPADSNDYAAIQPHYNIIQPVGSRRPAHSNNSSSGAGNSSNPPSISNNTVLPNSNTGGAAPNGVRYSSNGDVFIDHQRSPRSAPLRDTSAATSAATSPAISPATSAASSGATSIVSRTRAEALVNGSNGMIDRTSVSTHTQTTGLVFSASSTPNRPALSSAQPIHSNSNPAPSPSPLISTQPSNVQSSVLSTSSSLLSSNMTTSAPPALSLLQTAGVPPNTLLPLQIQANPILQQYTQPQVAWFGRHSLVVCVVCGGICKVTDFADRFANDLDGFEDNETPDWMRPILAQAKPGYLESNHDDADLIEQIQPTAFLGGSRGMKLGSETLSLNTMDSLIKIPVHRACFEIAQIFCKDQTRSSNGFRGADGGAPGSIPQLYEVWCKRAIASNPWGLMSKPILEPSLYSGAPAPLCKTIADYWRAMHKDPSLGRFHAYPLDIPDLTDMVVGSNLQTMDCKVRHARNELARLLNRIQDMPQEIADQILGGLEPFEENRGPPLRPTRVLPPIWWKRMLLSGKLIPWLWDLNENDLLRYRINNFYKDNVADAVRELERGEYVFDENMWDWELLCRQLAQFNAMEKGGLLEGKSERLWNRRRIWKLLDAARLGHVRFS